MQQITRQRTKPGPKVKRRMPFSELEEYLRGEDYFIRHHDSTGMAAHRVMPGYIADACGVSRSIVHSWRRRDLSLIQADRAACALGVHPLTIWPHWGREDD